MLCPEPDFDVSRQIRHKDVRHGGVSDVRARQQYVGQLAQIQQAASRTEDYAARRAATFLALSPKTGEFVLEIGCGSGLFVRQTADAVGATGKAYAIDVSADQVEAARVNCADLSNVELRVGSALALPYADGVFDAVATIQVLEYLEEVPLALAEMYRVLKPGGRFINFATNWGALFWNSRQPALTLQYSKHRMSTRRTPICRLFYEPFNQRRLLDHKPICSLHTEHHLRYGHLQLLAGATDRCICR